MKPSQVTEVVGTVTYDAMWADIASRRRGRPEGEGWKNLDEIAELRKCTVEAARTWAARESRIGNLERVAGSTESGQSAFFYRPIGKPRDPEK